LELHPLALPEFPTRRITWNSQNSQEVPLEYGWNWDDLGELREQGVI